MTLRFPTSIKSWTGTLISDFVSSVGAYDVSKGWAGFTIKLWRNHSLKNWIDLKKSERRACSLTETLSGRKSRDIGWLTSVSLFLFPEVWQGWSLSWHSGRVPALSGSNATIISLWSMIEFTLLYMKSMSTDLQSSRTDVLEDFPDPLVFRLRVSRAVACVSYGIHLHKA